MENYHLQHSTFHATMVKKNIDCVSKWKSKSAADHCICTIHEGYASSMKIYESTQMQHLLAHLNIQDLNIFMVIMYVSLTFLRIAVVCLHIYKSVTYLRIVVVSLLFYDSRTGSPVTWTRE